MTIYSFGSFKRKDAILFVCLFAIGRAVENRSVHVPLLKTERDNAILWECERGHIIDSSMDLIIHSFEQRNYKDSK